MGPGRVLGGDPTSLGKRRREAGEALGVLVFGFSGLRCSGQRGDPPFLDGKGKAPAEFFLSWHRFDQASSTCQQFYLSGLIPDKVVGNEKGQEGKRAEQTDCEGFAQSRSKRWIPTLLQL